eukprot:8374446-Lingulodinium_polyedra.AAC.1
MHLPALPAGTVNVATDSPSTAGAAPLPVQGPWFARPRRAPLGEAEQESPQALYVGRGARNCGC